ncbi:hypothetical protein [Cohnella silvisoli]|uniref:Uncharacterized protein n=1 Tax=Cohnella silvisoli TaxID=2873699 RepID=A0ABV1KN84_9BACL|nr:hypothetical protein [Cohnella silvisoli]MCD9020603.1 hypothetical protein [Cohnella silvisoli]
MHLLLGNETPFKIWLNGELVATVKEPAMWMPYNHVVLTELKSGKNRLVMKLLGFGKSMDFSYQMRNEASKMHLFTDLATIIE